MPRNTSQLPERTGKQNELLAWLREFFSQFGLAWRLFWDERVPFSTKIVPLLTLFYLLMPIDLLPDGILGVGQMDDLVLLLVGLRLFISLCPLELVDEHRQSLHPVEMDDATIPQNATIIDVKVVEPEESEIQEE